ncbi:MAG: hypothetical protein ACK4PI_04100 [Tepidisphaerales bacterium]
MAHADGSNDVPKQSELPRRADPLVTAVQAARRPDVRQAVHAVYAELEREIARRRPRCDISGRCCHFDAYGHRLYVTTAELATFLDDLDAGAVPRTMAASTETRRAGGLALPVWQGPSCPLLVDGLCSVHPVRPFGCRVFFCDPDASAWVRDTYEAIHRRLRAVHDELGLSYHYVEWRSALSRLGIGLGTARRLPRGL